MKRAVLALALAAVACAPALPLDGTVCVDPAMAPEHVEAVIAGVELWRVDSGARVSLRTVMAADGDMCDVNVRTTALSDGVRSGHAQADRIRMTWPMLHPSQWAPAVAHELGHAMGAEHSSDASDLMHDVLRAQQHATAADVQQILEAQ